VVPEGVRARGADHERVRRHFWSEERGEVVLGHLPHEPIRGERLTGRPGQSLTRWSLCFSVAGGEVALAGGLSRAGASTGYQREPNEDDSMAHSFGGCLRPPCTRHLADVLHRARQPHSTREQEIERRASHPPESLCIPQKPAPT